MSFASDLAYNEQAKREWKQAFLRDEMEWHADRVASQSGKHFIEFYDETGRPSPTGLIATKKLRWTLIFADKKALVSVPTDVLRLFCYPAFQECAKFTKSSQCHWHLLVLLSRIVSGRICRSRR